MTTPGENEMVPGGGMPVTLRLNEWLGVAVAIERRFEEMNKSVVFEAHAPGGQVYRVNEDGSCSGFPEGTYVVNGFVRRYMLCAALLKKCLDAGLISSDEASSLAS